MDSYCEAFSGDHVIDSPRETMATCVPMLLYKAHCAPLQEGRELRCFSCHRVIDIVSADDCIRICRRDESCTKIRYAGLMTMKTAVPTKAHVYAPRGFVDSVWCAKHQRYTSNSRDCFVHCIQIYFWLQSYTLHSSRTSIQGSILREDVKSVFNFL